MSMSDSPDSSAWQPWQPEDLQFDSDLAVNISPASGEAMPCEEQIQAELKRRREQAEQKGFAQGHAKGIQEGQQRGYQAGLEQGRKEGTEQALAEARLQQQELNARFSRLIDEFHAALDSLDSVIPSRLVQLSLTAARSILGKTILCDNTILLEKIQQLLQQDSLLNGALQLRVSAGDLPFVQENFGTLLAQRGWEIVADDRILPGGCRIVSDEGEMDATLSTHWQALCELSREDYGI